jgi:hypothetical protein
MLDYYGSIQKDHGEIKREFKSLFKEKYSEEILESIIKDETYSVSGYGMFFFKEILAEYKEKYSTTLLRNEKKLSLSYSLKEMDVDKDLNDSIGNCLNLKN